MGSRWTVRAWVRNEAPDVPGPGFGQEFYDELVYAGERCLGVIWAAIRAKRRGAGCVTIEWR